MAGENVLVFGGTGVAGICLLRELLFRKHQVIVYARNPSKVPDDLAKNPLLEIVKGEIADTEAISSAVARSKTILSLLGPTGMRIPAPEEYAVFYRNLLGLMRQHGVRRIFAMGTISIYRPEDSFSLIRTSLVTLVRTVVPAAYRIILSIRDLFDDADATRDIDWTVYRIAGIPGGSDEESWKADRENGKTYVGPVGAPGWSSSQRRAALARWLVDVAESGAAELIGQMPAVARDANS